MTKPNTNNMSKTKQTTKKPAVSNNEVDNEAAFLNNYGVWLESIDMVKSYSPIPEDVCDPKDVLATYLVKNHLEKECAELSKKLPDYSEEVIRRMAIVNLTYEAIQFHDSAFYN